MLADRKRIMRELIHCHRIKRRKHDGIIDNARIFCQKRTLAFIVAIDDKNDLMQDVNACPEKEERQKIGKMEDGSVNNDRRNNECHRNDRPETLAEFRFEQRPRIGRIHVRAADGEGNDRIDRIPRKIRIETDRTAKVIRAIGHDHQYNGKRNPRQVPLWRFKP